MPLLRIYRCESCDRTSARQDEQVPLCGRCRGAMKWKQTREYKPELHGWSTGMQAPALDFNQTAGRVAPIGEHGVPINSLNDIRRIERESEKMARDGVGEQYVFRKYAQDHGNLHEHTLGKNPEQAPSRDWLEKQAFDYRGVSPDVAEAETMGPGAREDLASALPESPHG